MRVSFPSLSLIRFRVSLSTLDTAPSPSCIPRHPCAGCDHYAAHRCSRCVGLGFQAVSGCAGQQTKPSWYYGKRKMLESVVFSRPVQRPWLGERKHEGSCWGKTIPPKHAFISASLHLFSTVYMETYHQSNTQEPTLVKATREQRRTRP